MAERSGYDYVSSKLGFDEIKGLVNWAALEKMLPPHEDLGELNIGGLRTYSDDGSLDEGFEFSIWREPTKYYWEQEDQKTYLEDIEDANFVYVSGSYPNSKWGVCRWIIAEGSE